MLSLLILLIRVVHCGYQTDTDQEEIKSSYMHNNNNNKVNFNSNSENDNNRILGGDDAPQYLYSECQHFFDNKLVLGLFVSSLVFLVFTCSMACEQLEAIESGQGKIARMKLRVGQAGTELHRVTEEFNEMFGSQKPSWHWFLPTAVQFPGSMRTVVLGYEWDETLPAAPYQEDGESSSDVEMEELENGRLKSSPSSAPVPLQAREDVLLTRAVSDVSNAESQSNARPSSTRNRRVNSRSSDDAAGPRIV